MLPLTRMQDIHLSDIELKQQYYNLFFNGNIDGAKFFVKNNPQLDSKVLSADNMNQLISGINELEDEYFIPVTNVLQKHLQNYQLSIDELIYMKDFMPTEQYEIGNFVLYNLEVYFCFKKPPIGNLPTDILYWINLGLKGLAGRANLGVKYSGLWLNTKDYVKYDLVSFRNRIFVSKTNNKNKNPYDNPNDWLLAMWVKPQSFFVGVTEPIGMKENDIWLKYI